MRIGYPCTKSCFVGLAGIALVLLTIFIAVPVSAAVAVDARTATNTTVTTTPSATIVQPSVSATVSSATPAVGTPVTISGIATGGNLSAGVQIWIFAGNYVNVSVVPVRSNGTFSNTYPTTGFPPATYYVFVQSPGNDGVFNMDLQSSGVYSGDVVNTQTGALLFNFTGAGSVQDAAASKALSDAINLQAFDAVYTNLTFQLVAQGTTPTERIPASPVSTTVARTQLPATTQSPLSTATILAGLCIAGLAATWFVRR
jgi:hypothetical protein